MSNLNLLKIKIVEVGGVKKNPSCSEDLNSDYDDDFLLSLENYLGNKIPSSYLSFYKIFGPISFVENVKVRCIDENPIAFNDKVAVNYFYSLTDSGQCSIKKLLETYSDQVPKHLLPICDGESGDLICIDLSSINYGKIYYWYHEGEEQLFFIANNFEDFIFKLEIDNEEISKEVKGSVQVRASDKLLEMLRKSGHGSD